ncbi:hypothetical protein [Nonomuraea rubra]|uniref:Uncharacterized protein n=1 Tax=Nonomuraea rubra TaxID=46180 RepID=A0A7X0U169_9ACTN|nr:hypothetical protein [Nonomuraea rubra]MBB6551371.1 hypothetical protein [Nonomuraea rubra]
MNRRPPALGRRSDVVHGAGTAERGPGAAGHRESPGVRLHFRHVTPEIVENADAVLSGVDGMLMPHGVVSGLPAVELAGERHRGPRPAAVEQPPVGAEQLGLVDHGEQRGDADAAGDEQVPLGGRQGEVVAGAADRHRGAYGQLVVDVGRAAPAVRFPEHADAVGVRVPPVAAQRVLAGQAARQDQVQVRAGRPVRQAAPVRVFQGQGDHAVGDRRPGGHPQVESGFRDHACSRVVRRKACTASPPAIRTAATSRKSRPGGQPASCAAADSSIPPAAMTRQARIRARRPMRSASGARNSEPRAVLTSDDVKASATLRRIYEQRPSSRDPL